MTSQPGHKVSGNRMKMRLKISSLQYFALKVRDGRHTDPGGRVVLRRGDEGATGVCVLTSEWQYKDVLIDIDDQVWRDLSDGWQKYLSLNECGWCPKGMI